MHFIRWSAFLRSAAVVAIALQAVVARAETALPVRPAPLMEVSALSLDGGAVEEGTVAKFHFTVTNRGQADLVISQVKPSCGCTAAHWDRLVPPGKEGVIDAEIKTTNFRGPIQKHVTVFSNDPQRPELELNTTTTVLPQVQVDPGVVALLSVDDQPVSHVFTLERRGGRPMRLLQVVCAQPYVRLEMTRLPGEGRYELKTTVTENAPWGRSAIPVLIRTDIEEATNLNLTLIVDRGIITTPPLVYFNLPSGKLPEPPKATVSLQRQKGAFHVKTVTVDDPNVRASVVVVHEGQEYQVTVSYVGRWEPGRMQSTVTVTTDDPKQPEINIPVQAILQSVSGGH